MTCVLSDGLPNIIVIGPLYLEAALSSGSFGECRSPTFALESSITYDRPWFYTRKEPRSRLPNVLPSRPGDEQPAEELEALLSPFGEDLIRTAAFAFLDQLRGSSRVLSRQVTSRACSNHGAQDGGSCSPRSTSLRREPHTMGRAGLDTQVGFFARRLEVGTPIPASGSPTSEVSTSPPSPSSVT